MVLLVNPTQGNSSALLPKRNDLILRIFFVHRFCTNYYCFPIRFILNGIPALLFKLLTPSSLLLGLSDDWDTGTPCSRLCPLHLCQRREVMYLYISLAILSNEYLGGKAFNFVYLIVAVSQAGVEGRHRRMQSTIFACGSILITAESRRRAQC
jgi:hypothetical protein